MATIRIPGDSAFPVRPFTLTRLREIVYHVYAETKTPPEYFIVDITDEEADVVKADFVGFIPKAFYKFSDIDMEYEIGKLDNLWFRVTHV